MYFEDFRLGDRFELPPVIITIEKIESFAREYDPLKIHTDEEYAKSTRFGGIIAPGVMSFMSVWAEFVKLDIWGGEIVAGKSTAIEWHAPVYPDDTLSGVVEITALQEQNATGTVEVTVEIFNQSGAKIITDKTLTVIKKRKS